ncbi:hypothetical protein GEMRC1_006843 [Eukaryota sp. GEM-RC1]
MFSLYIYLVNIPLNSVTFLFVALNISFAVDFVSYIVYTFSQTNGNSVRERVIASVSQHSGVIHGASTTLISVISVSFQSQLFSVFFQITLCIMTICTVVSFLFLPVLLTLFGRWLRPQSKSGVVTGEIPRKELDYKLNMFRQKLEGVSPVLATVNPIHEQNSENPE